MNSELKKLFSPNSAAHALDISRSKVYDLMKSGHLRFVLIGADRRIPAEEIDRLATEGTPAIK
jgi:excisionase family DNA binding protein